jgi:hypothetical protein
VQDRYVSFESLLMTDRAVKRTGRWLRISPAGSNPKPFWLEFENRRSASVCGRSLLTYLRMLQGGPDLVWDNQYNEIIYRWLKQTEQDYPLKNRRTDSTIDDDNEGTSASE